MNETKSIFKSTGIWGGMFTSLAFVVMGAFGFHLDKAQTLGLVEAIKEVYPAICGIIAGVVIIWSRLKHIDFDSINWPGLTSALLALLASFGVDTKDLQHMTGETSELAAKLPGMIASAVSLYGVLAAKKELVIKRATPAE